MSSDLSKIDKNITLKDIAESTGYTINTVSRALNDKSDISEATKVLIRKKAKELGYIKNALAGSLRSKTTKTLAVIVGDISNPFFGILVKEIEVFARQCGYTTIIFNTEEESAFEGTAVRLALEKNVDGIILCPAQKNQETVLLLKRMGFPFVLIGRYYENIDCDYIIADDRHAGYIATKHLIEKGHHNILFFNGPKYISSAHLRYLGYLDALKEYNLPSNPDLVKEISITNKDWSPSVDYAPSSKLFTAILAFSDMIAFNYIDTMLRMGQSLNSVEIVGFDNIQSDLRIPYPLTTIHYDKAKMAQSAVEILLERIAHPEQTCAHVILETRLIAYGIKL